MKGHIINLEQETVGNSDFRRVLYTGKNLQLVLMSIPAGGEIGEEVHATHDQFLRVDAGAGEAVIDGTRWPVRAPTLVVVPTRHVHGFRDR